MTVINTNTSALRAQSGSRLATQSLQTAMERLSTGKRINSAKDDAAGRPTVLPSSSGSERTLKALAPRAR